MSEQSSPNGDIENIRTEYSRKTLREDQIAAEPIAQFDQWFSEALSANVPDANAMTLATATPTGRPSARIVLLKAFDEAGFRFYTNYKSRKAAELEQNSQAALCFYWSKLERQVRIEGEVTKLDQQESEDYFTKRPRQSQLSAWASSQSKKVASREQLEHDFELVKKRFKDKDIPLPDFWGGYLLQPKKIEFWQGRPGRLHDRILYSRNDKGDWSIRRLAP